MYIISNMSYEINIYVLLSTAFNFSVKRKPLFLRY